MAHALTANLNAAARTVGFDTESTGAFPRLLGALAHRSWRSPAGRSQARPTAAWRLETNATAWLNRPLGCTVTCEVGTLWLTFDNEPQDVILEAGQSHLCTKPSKLAIHALAAAAVSVD